MSLFMNLIETYDKCSSIVGVVPIDDKGVKHPQKTLLPLFHSTFKSEFCVTINEDGQLVRLERDEKIETIIIPMSESSASRSSGVAAHPLCDQIGYVDKELDKTKFNAYIDGLEKWKDDNKKLNAIYQYLTNNSVLNDIFMAGLLKDAELDSSGQPNKNRVIKLGVRFSVQIPNDSVSNVWEDKAIFEKWIDYCKKTGEKFEGFDYVLGEELTQIARLHPKNINSFVGNAKLMSCNDSSGFTFRGRFDTQDDAVLVDAVSSQKAHLCLKWLINNVGYFVDKQVIVVWAVDENYIEKVSPFDNSFDAVKKLSRLDMLEEEADNNEKTDNDALIDAFGKIHKNYAKEFSNVLRGLGQAAKLEKHNNKIVVAAFDASTSNSGRLGVTFYRELPKDKYLESISNWHEKAAWNMIDVKEDKIVKGKRRLVKYQGCPSYYEILNAVYGKASSPSDKGYAKLKKDVYRILLESMFGSCQIPSSFVKAAAQRASQPMSFTDSNGKFSEFAWNKALNTTCAMIKENYINKFKEDISMELDEKRNDRSYLYGRLLAVADMIEKVAMYDPKNKTARNTNALRLMCKFSLQPHSTWGIILSQLHPYMCKLKNPQYFQNFFNEICALFKDGDFESNEQLTPMFFLGYSNQNKYFNDKRKDKNANKSEDEELEITEDDEMENIDE